MSAQDENDAISALTGFSISHVLGGLELPSGDSLTNRLGISGVPSLNQSQIYSENWDEDDIVGPEQGQDWEDEIDREMREEEESDGQSIKQEVHSPPGLRQKQKRIRVVKRLVERPKTVYERFPAFEKDKVLDFSELFKGYAVRKSRLSKRPYQGKPIVRSSLARGVKRHFETVEIVYPRKRENPRGFLDAIVGDTKRQVESKRVEEVVASGNVEAELRKALEVCLFLTALHLSGGSTNY